MPTPTKRVSAPTISSTTPTSSKTMVAQAAGPAYGAPAAV